MFTAKLSSVILTMLLIVPFAFAQTQEYQASVHFQGSEAALLTPWTLFEKSIRDFAVTKRIFEQQFDDRALQVGQFQFQLSGLGVKAESEFKTSDLSAGQLSLGSSGLQATLTVNRVSIDQIIEQVIDGAIIRVRVQAECGPIVLTQKEAQANGVIRYQFNRAGIVTQLEQFDLKWPQVSWVIAPITCVGLTGFNKVLETELAQNLQNADQFRPYVRDVLAKEIQKEIAALVERLRAPQSLPLPEAALPLRIEFTRFESRDEGLITYARLVWGASEKGIREFNVGDWPHETPSNQPTLLLPQQGLSDYIEAGVTKLPSPPRINLRKFAFFNKVMKSRLLQFFIFPNLLNYSKEAPFYLDVMRPQNLKLTWNENSTAHVSLHLQAYVRSFRAGSWWKFISICGDPSATLKPTIRNGLLRANVIVQPRNLDLGYTDEYIRAFQPRTTIKGFAVDNLIKSVSKQTYHVGLLLPRIGVGPLGVAVAQSLKTISGGIIAIPLKLQSEKQVSEMDAAELVSE